MQTIKQLSKGKKDVGVFYHVETGASVIAIVEGEEFGRGDVAFDKKGKMICRAVYSKDQGDPVYDYPYEVVKLIATGEPEETLDDVPTVEVTDEEAT